MGALPLRLRLAQAIGQTGGHQGEFVGDQFARARLAIQQRGGQVTPGARSMDRGWPGCQ